MSFLKRAIREGISKGIGDAVSSAVKQAVEPKATEWANKTAQRFDEAAQSHTQEVKQSFSGLEGAFSNLQRAAENYATEVSKNIKVCPGCGETVPAEKKFCPGCGAKLPERTAAQGALCPSCGKQNTVGMKYCDECGTKLPAAIEEEEAARQKMEDALAQWDSILPAFPKWDCGGRDILIEQHDPSQCSGFIASVTVGFPREPPGRLPWTGTGKSSKNRASAPRADIPTPHTCTKWWTVHATWQALSMHVKAVWIACAWNLPYGNPMVVLTM